MDLKIKCVMQLVLGQGEMLPQTTSKEISCILMPEKSHDMGILLIMYVCPYVCSCMLACTYRYIDGYVELEKHQVSSLLLLA